MHAITHSIDLNWNELLKTPFTWLLTVSTPIVLVVVVHVIWQLLRPKHNLPPVVFHWVPFIGSAFSYGKDPSRFTAECREKYGDVFTMIMLGRKMTLVVGARGNKFVLGAKPNIFSAEDAYREFSTPVFGKDVGFDVPNEVFVEQKKFLRFGLSTDNFRAYTGIIEDEVNLYLQTDTSFDLLKKGEDRAWGVFDANKILSRLIIHTATSTLHGREVRAQLDHTIAGLYSDLDGGLGPLTFLFPHLPLELYRKRDRAQQALSTFYIDIIRKRRNAPIHEHDHDLIASLLQQKYGDGTPLKDHVIAHLMIAILMAGRHTTASTGSWILIYLARNPDVAEALYAEQVQFFGSPNREVELEPMTYDKVRLLPLMNAVIKETLRLHPPIHSVMRYVREDTSIPSTIASPSSASRSCSESEGLFIPRGHRVLACPAVSQRDPTLWKNATIWDPYRWTDPRGVAAEVSRVYENEVGDYPGTKLGIIGTAENPYQPFGAGAHRCIGEQFANMQLAVIIGCIIRKVQLLREKDVPNNNYYVFLSQSPGDLLIVLQTFVTKPTDGEISYCRRDL